MAPTILPLQADISKSTMGLSKPPLLSAASGSGNLHLSPDMEAYKLGSTMILKPSDRQYTKPSLISMANAPSSSSLASVFNAPMTSSSAAASSSSASSSSLSFQAITNSTIAGKSVESVPLLNGNSTRHSCRLFEIGSLDRHLPASDMFYRSTYFKEFFVGFFTSIITSIILQPLDTLRINQIINQKSLLTTISTIYSRQGIGQFYRTTTINALAFGSTYGIYFPINRYLKNENPFNIENIYLQYFMATIPPSIISMTIVNPLWVMKSVQTSASETRFSIADAARLIYKTKGFRGFYSGLIFGYLNSINGVVTFTLYDIFKFRFNATTAIEYTLYSSIAKTCAYLVSYPLLALRIRQQINQLSIMTNLKMVCRESIYSIYYGLSITLVQNIPRTAIQMSMYEKMLECLK